MDRREQGHQLRGDRLLPTESEPQEHEEAPLREELPERQLIRTEEVLEILDRETEVSDSWFEPFASSCFAGNDANSRRYIHACLTLSQISAKGATHVGSEGSLAGTTVGSSNADVSEFVDESDPWDDDDLYVVGSQFQISQYLQLMVTIFENRDQRVQNIRIQQRLPKKVVRINSVRRIHLVLWRLVKLRMK